MDILANHPEAKLINWTHAGTAFIAAFLASTVEFVEAFTIVLAVGTTRGWRSALMGTAAGVALLTLLVLVFGPALQQIPLTTLQLVVGVLLLLFGMRWLRKAILRSAGVIGLHDETAIYERERTELAADGNAGRNLDWIAFVTSFKAVSLEGLEVVFIVIATGVGGMLLPASAGAALAGLLVIGVAVALRAPLSRVPENTLKFAVGVLLSAFGVFWMGEGLRFTWRGEDLALVALVIAFLLVARASVVIARSARTNRLPGHTVS
ncbi:MAG: TMEM165/GDT1 family protein [Gemmatimonadota bacterium]|nr:TMEM165/GDT1 family protein [Gemmatimonadota bacterium]